MCAYAAYHLLYELDIRVQVGSELGFACGVGPTILLARGFSGFPCAQGLVPCNPPVVVGGGALASGFPLHALAVGCTMHATSHDPFLYANPGRVPGRGVYI